MSPVSRLPEEREKVFLGLFMADEKARSYWKEENLFSALLHLSASQMLVDFFQVKFWLDTLAPSVHILHVHNKFISMSNFNEQFLACIRKNIALKNKQTLIMLTVCFNYWKYLRLFNCAARGAERNQVWKLLAYRHRRSADGIYIQSCDARAFCNLIVRYSVGGTCAWQRRQGSCLRASLGSCVWQRRQASCLRASLGPCVGDADAVH